MSHKSIPLRIVGCFSVAAGDVPIWNSIVLELWSLPARDCGQKDNN